jgi:hypothetical protein
MHVTHLDDQASPLAAFSAPPFRSEEWRNLGLASCARLAANLGNGTIQRTPRQLNQRSASLEREVGDNREMI